jgi:hypothetical protein
MTLPPHKKTRPSTRLVVHDIQIELTPQPDSPNKLSAYVDCEHHQRRLSVDECRACDRLDRIDSHEAGFVVLCRSSDEPFDSGE